VYPGTSPGGAGYRIVNGKASEYFAPKARYIWSLAVGADGALYVGTGDRGQIFRVAASGQGELYYETGQAHVTGLALDSQGRLLAGTGPNGILYRISGKGKAFALYAAGLPEIRAIVPLADGTVYAAALGGSVARRAQAASQAGQNASPAAIPTITTTVTVEAQSGEIKPPDPNNARTPAAPVAATPPLAQAAAPVEASGVDKSAVYRINPDNTVETLWSSKDENVYDVLALDKQVLFSTDANGRIYRVTPEDRLVTLVAETNEGEAMRLLPSGNSVLAATGDMGRIFRLGVTPGPAGSYESPVHDSGAVARWGSISWIADAPAGCAVAFRTRTGNSARPDQTWSDWSNPLADRAGSRIPSPNARYIQWKLEMAGNGRATPMLSDVTVSYLPQNSPPVVKNVSVYSQPVAAPAGSPKPASPTSSDAAYSVTVSASADPGSAGASPQVLSHASPSQITVAWQAEDPDGDRLVYSVYFRGEDEAEWKLLKRDVHDSSISLDGDSFADGRYYFRVVASDGEVNPASTAREAQSISAPVLIDNTPPVAVIGTVRRAGSTAHIEFEAADAASPLRRCEYAVDASGWTPVEASGGIIDGLRMKFALDLTGLAPGEHLVVVRVADSAGNTGLAKVTLK